MDIFKNTDIGSVPLIEYINWFLNEKSLDYNLIQLPPIQRNSVWRVSQIEKLWDSLLRGFPIGSFLLSSREKGSRARTIVQKEQFNSDSDGFFLLDGQQRTRALLLGFAPNDTARLWIDLDPKLIFGNMEHNDRHFMLRLTTSYQPWGMKNSNPDEKLNENQKYIAREKIYKTSIHYDYEVKISNLNDNNTTSYPIEASLPIPFDALVNLCGGFTGNFYEPHWEEVQNLIPNIFRNESLQEPIHLKKIILSLRRILDNSSENKNLRCVSLLKHNGDFEGQNGTEQESIEVLFRRVNSGGTVLAGEEMQYSLLKASWDGAYDMVSSIVNDGKIGYLFSSTGIVLSATRLARFNIEETDIPNPSVSNFRRWIGSKAKGSENSFLSEMRKLLDKDIESGKSIYHSVVESFCDLVLFNENSHNDIGLPKKMLLSINSKYYQPILIWLYLNHNDRKRIAENRLPILRYLMFSFIGFKDASKVSKRAVELIKANRINFPDKKIYTECIDISLASLMPSLKEFKQTLNPELGDGFLHDWQTIMGKDNDVENFKFRDFRNAFWNKKELLIWFQREYHSKWFKGYDPMSDDSFDTPYDYDHILAYSHLITSGGSNNTGSTDTANNNRFSASRWIYINSIGNYRTWALWANRSDNNKCHTIKLRLKNMSLENDSTAQKLGLNTKLDFLKASLINPDDLELWENAGGNPRDWNEKRRTNWQRAVERRVLYLYEIFYSSFGFSEWQEE